MATTANRRPNFVFIVADDLGYADLGCYGGRVPCSPQIDRLAANGLRFVNGYANSPVCSPTRFALATGRYQYRLRGGIDEPISSRSRGSTTLGLPPGHPTLASLLAGAGYHTALVGKWHLGYPPVFSPLKSGYHEFFGLQAGGVDYFSHVDPVGAHDLWEGETEVHRDGYLTDLITERALAVIERQRDADRPFLLSVHYTAPHWPWESRNDKSESDRIGKAIIHLDGGSLATYHAMIGHMDEGIGRLRDALATIGALDDTLIVFTSDNGGERYSDNWPLMGGKMDLLEGGIRVPYVAHWPARIRAGQVSAQQVITMDWVATMLGAAGVVPHADYPLDGLDLAPVLADASTIVERELFWRMKYKTQRAMRSGRWKYFAQEGNEFLFDVDHDPRERANQALRQPERLAAMRERWLAWERTMPPVAADAAYSLPYSRATLATP